MLEPEIMNGLVLRSLRESEEVPVLTKMVSLGMIDMNFGGSWCQECGSFIKNNSKRGKKSNIFLHFKYVHKDKLNMAILAAIGEGS